LLHSVALFALAGLAEIGGGYLMWLWWREGRPWPVGLLGAAVLVVYGLIPTYQAAHFGRVYAAYGGVFLGLGRGSGHARPLRSGRRRALPGRRGGHHVRAARDLKCHRPGGRRRT